MLLTDIGQQKISDAILNGTQVQITEFALGDGGGATVSPTSAWTSLTNEVWRGPVSTVLKDVNDPTRIVVEGVVPPADGGFYIREIGLFDSVGDLIAVGSFPETYKPVNVRELSIRMVLQVTDSAAVTVQIDPNLVLATQGYVDRKTARLNNVVNVKEHGAVGDGVTDDTTALQNIIANLVTNGTVLYFPKGVYKISSTLTFTGLQDLHIVGDGVGLTEINATGFNGQHFVFDDCQRITLKNFRLTGEGINGANSVGGIWFKLTNATNNPYHIIEAIEIDGVTNSGLVMAVPILTNLRNVKMVNVAGDCFNFYNGTSVHLDACYAITSTEAGFKFTNMTYCVLNACAAEVNGVGYDFVNSKSIVCNGCGSEDQLNRSALYPGFAFRTDGQKVQLNACYARSSAAGHFSEVNGGKFTLVDFFDGDTFSFVANSGLDADTVDGLEASAFALAADLNTHVSSSTDHLTLRRWLALFTLNDGFYQELTYDANGNVSQIDVYTDSTKATLLGSATLTYDTNGNLTQVSYSFDGQTYTQTLTYDANGNLLSVDQV